MPVNDMFRHLLATLGTSGGFSGTAPRDRGSVSTSR
jgi:hypothetical protein